MAIEGPLHELSIHDVFQLLDLTRKTGSLRVTAAQRDDEAMVLFERGRVISASLRSSPTPLGTILLQAGRVSEHHLAQARQMQTAGDTRRLGEILVAIGAVSPRELERHVRLQIEAVVFEIMSWDDGFFSFESRDVHTVPIAAKISLATESLLMEGVRRIDEWTRIADRVPHLDIVPVLAAPEDAAPASMNLQPNEWELLGVIDGVQDLRVIAMRLGRSELEVAEMVHRLATNGVVTLRDLRVTSTGGEAYTSV